MDSGPAGTSLLIRGGAEAGAYWGRATVAVGGSEESNVVVALRRAVSVRGRFVIEFDPAQAKPATPPALSVGAEPATANGALGRPRSIRPEPSTEFAIDGLLADSYFLRPGYPPAWVVKSVLWNGRDYLPLDASTGQDFDGVVITFTNAAASLSGRVLDGQGRPAAGAAVIVFPVERRLWTDYGLKPTRIKSVSVSPRGAFQLSSLPAGDYYLIAVPGAEIDAWQEADFFKNAEPRAARVSVGWGEKKTQDLALGGTRGK